VKKFDFCCVIWEMVLVKIRVKFIEFARDVEWKFIKKGDDFILWLLGMCTWFYRFVFLLNACDIKWKFVLFILVVVTIKSKPIFYFIHHTILLDILTKPVSCQHSTHNIIILHIIINKINTNAFYQNIAWNISKILVRICMWNQQS